MVLLELQKVLDSVKRTILVDKLRDLGLWEIAYEWFSIESKGRKPRN